MLLYRGPKAWLVSLNLLVACVALFPTIVECCLWLLHAGAWRLLGELSAIPAVFGAAFLAALGESWYVVSIPILLACLFIHLLFRTPEIPARVRMTTALLVTVAFLILLVNVGVLNWQYRHGVFKGLFL